MTETEEEADAQRPLLLVHELARGVVDGRDVIGVEGVTHPERVGEDPRAHTEDLGLADPVVMAESQGQHGPAHDMESDDRDGHTADPNPWPRGEPVTVLHQPGPGVGHRSRTPRPSASWMQP